jgi:glycosyltransferase involved in cell wall biosynthesis
MRILEVTHYMPPHDGGIERVARAISDGLRARGHEVRWIASAVPAKAGDDGVYTRVRSINTLEDRLGVPYPLWSPIAFARLGALVAGADVVHAHDCLYQGSAGAAIACRAFGVPLVITQHVGEVPFGPLLDRVQWAAYATLGRSVLRSADRVVVVAAQVGEWCASVANVSAELVPNGVSARFAPASREAREEARARWEIPQGARVVLFVGRLVPKKGIATVVEAQRTLAEEGVLLLAVGDGPLASELAHAPNLLRYPRVPAESMPDFYAAADVLFLPSRGEGLPLTVQEALCSGVPVVVSDDPAFGSNLGDLAGVAMCDSAPVSVGALRHWLDFPPSRESIASSARARWGTTAAVARYEAILADAASGARRRRVVWRSSRLAVQFSEASRTKDTRSKPEDT